jgi:phage-related protein
MGWIVGAAAGAASLTGGAANNNTRVIIRRVPHQIEFYNAKVQAEIAAWPAGIEARFVALARRMVEHGPNLGMPHTRSMGDGLLEVRVKAAEGIGRAFYCTLVGQRIVVLHGFIKKTDKTPPKELKIARDRMKEIA